MLCIPFLRHTALAVLMGCLTCLAAGAASAESGHEHHHHAAIQEPTIDMEVLPESPVPGAAAAITFTFKDPAGNPVRNLAIVHDRILHVVIIGEDLNTFAHIHPEDLGPVTGDMKEKGSFTVRYTFPKAGKYLIAADYALGDSHFSEQFSADVTGEPKMVSAARDLSREKTFGSYSVVLKTDPRRVRSGRQTVITYSLKKDGNKVKDVVPYLSAAMHVAVVSADLNHFIHAHGDIPGSATEGGGHMHRDTRKAYGPDIETGVLFPVAGLYRVFGEFRHEGRIVLLDFMVEAE